MKAWHAPVIGIVLGGMVLLAGWAIGQHPVTPRQNADQEPKDRSPLPPPSGLEDWVPEPDLKTWLRECNTRIPIEIKNIDKEISGIRPKLRRAEDLRAELVSMAKDGGNKEAIASKLMKLSILIHEIDGHIQAIDSDLEQHIRSYYRK